MVGTGCDSRQFVMDVNRVGGFLDYEQDASEVLEGGREPSERTERRRHDAEGIGPKRAPAHWVSARWAVGVIVVAIVGAACGGAGNTPAARETKAGPISDASTPTSEGIDGVVDIDGERGLYVRCSGEGSPTVVLEGGDGDDSSSYLFAEESIAKVTRTCVYDRANLGQSDPAPGPRGLSDLVGDLEQLLQVAKIPGPYVLVGTSGGGFITGGYAFTHPDQTAGMVFVDTGAPLDTPPQEIVEATAPDNPANVEERDYLQVEQDAWAARKRIDNIPVTVITVDFSAAAESESPFPVEQRAMKNNVQRQKGWLVISPRAEQMVVKTGHAVEEERPDLVIDAILDVVNAAR